MWPSEAMCAHTQPLFISLSKSSSTLMCTSHSQSCHSLLHLLMPTGQRYPCKHLVLCCCWAIAGQLWPSISLLVWYQINTSVSWHHVGMYLHVFAMFPCKSFTAGNCCKCSYKNNIYIVLYRLKQWERILHSRVRQKLKSSLQQHDFISFILYIHDFIFC